MSGFDSFDNLNEIEFPGILEYPPDIKSFFFPNRFKNVFPVDKLSINKIEEFEILSKSSELESIQEKEKQKYNYYTKKKRGRKILDNSEKRKKNHDRTCPCNIRTKITIAYFSFLIKFINSIIDIILYKEENINQYKLKKIVHENNININFIKYLKNQTIEQIISNEMSNNNYIRKNNENKIICKKIIEKNIIFKNILNKKYMEFYENIFIHSKKEVDLSNYGINRTIFLNSDVILFEDFKNKIKREEKGNESDLKLYLSKIDECANNYLAL